MIDYVTKSIILIFELHLVDHFLKHLTDKPMQLHRRFYDGKKII